MGAEAEAEGGSPRVGEVDRAEAGGREDLARKLEAGETDRGVVDEGGVEMYDWEEEGLGMEEMETVERCEVRRGAVDITGAKVREGLVEREVVLSSFGKAVVVGVAVGVEVAEMEERLLIARGGVDTSSFFACFSSFTRSTAGTDTGAGAELCLAGPACCLGTACISSIALNPSLIAPLSSPSSLPIVPTSSPRSSEALTRVSMTSTLSSSARTWETVQASSLANRPAREESEACRSSVDESDVLGTR